MVVSANVLQVMCIRLGKVESGLDVKAVCPPAARRTLDPHDRYRGSSADLTVARESSDAIRQGQRPQSVSGNMRSLETLQIA